MVARISDDVGTREEMTRGGIAAAGNLPQVTRHGYCPVSILSAYIHGHSY